MGREDEIIEDEIMSTGDGRADAPVTVTICADGPLLMRGPFTLRTQDGRLVEAGRRTVALCRCGRSGTKPFCDGSHKLVGFRAAAAKDAAAADPA
ncbi:MAG TPA: CDGSH iron-sulfur domain-containing protein [Streptosporangiaceae bacterium]|nr:CDGSH iron-sulfur domain-containing protein [Streptosporangiaceae bacterium]